MDSCAFADETMIEVSIGKVAKIMRTTEGEWAILEFFDLQFFKFILYPVFALLFWLFVSSWPRVPVLCVDSFFRAEIGNITTVFARY